MRKVKTMNDGGTGVSGGNAKMEQIMCMMGGGTGSNGTS